MQKTIYAVRRSSYDPALYCESREDAEWLAHGLGMPGDKLGDAIEEVSVLAANPGRPLDLELDAFEGFLDELARSADEGEARDE